MQTLDLMAGALPVTLGNVALHLLPDRAAWLDEARALLVADVHLGKAETFRRHGVPVPDGVGDATLARLSALIEATLPQRLIVLGDLLHGPQAHRPAVIDSLTRWRDRHAGVDVALVRGNHDDRAGDPPARCGIQMLDEPMSLAGCGLRHTPLPRGTGVGAAAGLAGPTVAGHLHPAYRLRGRADRLRLACWWRYDDTLVLPAFGGFTGGHDIEPAPGDGVFVSDGERVHAVPLAQGDRTR